MAFKGFDLTGKVAVVVGGTSGIGRAITCGLADAGADIVPTSRRREEVEATAAEVESRGRKAVRVTSTPGMAVPITPRPLILLY